MIAIAVTGARPCLSLRENLLHLLHLSRQALSVSDCRFGAPQANVHPISIAEFERVASRLNQQAVSRSANIEASSRPYAVDRRARSSSDLVPF